MGLANVTLITLSVVIVTSETTKSIGFDGLAASMMYAILLKASL